MAPRRRRPRRGGRRAAVRRAWPRTTTCAAPRAALADVDRIRENGDTASHGFRAAGDPAAAVRGSGGDTDWHGGTHHPRGAGGDSPAPAATRTGMAVPTTRG